ncbi:hypothetical protein Tco_1002231 [Tanacetum coccineum]|uniref:Uncharacterized protein n=1 Tax=Tanacetum coccineum TaxID=301880 RepID=A0ABQ5F758_9ASTR
MGEGSANLTDPYHIPTFIQPSTQPQKIQNPRKPKRKDIQVPQPSDPTENVADEAVHKELGDSLVRAATSSLEAECQETMEDTIIQTRFENVSKYSNDSLLVRGNTLQSDKDRIKLDELMALCTTLQNRVLDLEKTKTTQHNEIAISLTARVESFDDEESLGKDASKQGRIEAINTDVEITLVSVHDEMEVDEEVVEVINTAKLIVDAAQVSVAGDKVSAASAATTISAATTTTAITVDDITLAQALEEMKNTKPKQKEDKGKGIWIEPVKPMKKKDQISFDEETALKLQAEFDEERLAREKAEKEQEANIALIETWDDIQAKIDADHQLT